MATPILIDEDRSQNLYRMRIPGMLIPAVVASALAATCPTQQLSIKQLRQLDRHTLDLASLQAPDEVTELREVLAKLGYPEKLLAQLDRRVKSARTFTRGRETRLKRVVKALKATSGKLDAGLGAIENAEARRKIATQLLRIDGDLEASHQAIGHVRVGDRWSTPEDARLVDRRTLIQKALQEVRQLQPPVMTAPSKHELLRHVLELDGVRLSSCGVTIHTGWPVAKTTRLLKNLIRAIAFSRHLIDGKPIVLPTGLGHTSVLFTGQPNYEKALAFDLSHQRVTAERAKGASKLAAYYRKNNTLINNRTMENHALAGIFSHISSVVSDRLYDQAYHPTLIAGHGNWVLMALTGAQLPGIAFRVKSNEVGTRSSAQKGDELLFGAGLMGARSWLRDRVLAGEDPAWTRSFFDQVGRIDDIDLLKTTFVVDYLQQKGLLGPVLKKSMSGVGKNKTAMISSIVAGIGIELSVFEESWRTWMRGVVGGRSSVLGRLGGDNNGLSADERAVVAYLGAIRDLALVDPALGRLPTVSLDRDLSANALSHAKYLERYPELAAIWPDCHEQSSDKEGFTAEGCWAGNHSVIAPGTLKAIDAVDGWMGTFFHRLPLLEPGLLRVGWGLAGQTAVMDSGSIVRPIVFEWQVSWPADGMHDVPRLFNSELPNPFPGVDQSAWGYPITLQLGPRLSGAAPVMQIVLRVGDANGPVVEGRLSTPQKPGNPLLVPKLAWCLIPRSPLKASTTYFVTAIVAGAEEQSIEWSFQTGR